MPSESLEDKGIDGMIKITHNWLSDFLLDHECSRNFFIDAEVGRSKITKRLLEILLTEGTVQILNVGKF